MLSAGLVFVFSLLTISAFYAAVKITWGASEKLPYFGIISPFLASLRRSDWHVFSISFSGKIFWALRCSCIRYSALCCLIVNNRWLFFLSSV